jgi:hypothetical protein
MTDQHAPLASTTDAELRKIYTDATVGVVVKSGGPAGLLGTLGRRAVYNHGTNDGFAIAQFGFLAQQTEVVREIAEDRDRQNLDEFRLTAGHPDGTGPDTTPLNLPGLPLPQHSTAAVYAAQTLAARDDAIYFGHATWVNLLIAQTFAITQEKDQTHLRTYLIELAATAQRWAEGIDERTTALAEEQLPAAAGVLADPDCIAGKHDNCSGKGLDVGIDQPAQCPCMCHLGGGR